jgi:uncharacterized protein
MDSRLAAEIARHPYPLLFMTISGAHLYGFASPDSDYDLRGVHLLPLQELVGLETGLETITLEQKREGLELDLVTHELKKFLLLLNKKNGYVLEQLYSPLVLHSSPAHTELKALAHACITRHHYHHYYGFARNQWELLIKEHPRRVKPLLYVFRVLLTGIHFLQTGTIEANLNILNETFNLPYLPELILRKQQQTEQVNLQTNELSFYESEYLRLLGVLLTAFEQSNLPDESTARPAFHDFLVRIRLGLA